MLKDNVVSFTAHLSATIKRLTRYKQKVVMVNMLEGTAANKLYYFVEKLKCHKISPINAFPQIPSVR